MKIVKQRVKLLWSSPDYLQTIERAGRTCYKSDAAVSKESTDKFIRTIIQNGHESVLDHSAASFKIICDRGVSHELVRHRIASYSQESTRYCNYGKDKFNNEITVIEPPGLTEKQKAAWLFAVGEAEDAYMDMLNEGATPQIARSVLPNCLKTEVVMTTNFREWRHILKLRLSKKAHPQIREIMFTIASNLLNLYPPVFEDLLTPDLAAEILNHKNPKPGE